MTSRCIAALRGAVVAGVVTGALLASSTAGAAPLADTLWRIHGAAAGDGAGVRVSQAGDVNGDGIPDVIVGAPGAATAAGPDGGAAYVVFGARSGGTVDLANLGSRGFRIARSAAGDGTNIGIHVSGAGDVNHDGRDDVIVAATEHDTGAPQSYTAWVVHGSASPAGVDLDALGARGWRITGLRAWRVDNLVHVGPLVDGAGDVNGDGYDDLVLGDAGYADPVRFDYVGGGVVVFGRRVAGDVDGSAPGSRGFRINGGGFGTGATVAGAGDVNADGRDDVLLGRVDWFLDEGRGPGGAVHVVYGSASTATVDLGGTSARALQVSHAAGEDDRIFGSFHGDGFAQGIDGAGDLNRDGRADVLVGAGRFNFYDGGAAWAVFGRTGGATIDLRSAKNLEVYGADPLDRGLGHRVTRGGDLDADGYDDAAIATYAGVRVLRGGTAAGNQYAPAAELAPGETAFIEAPGTWDLAGIGNVLGDARTELALGRPGEDPAGRADAGAVEIVDVPPLPCTITGTRGNDTLTGTAGDDVICGLAGADSIRGAGGDDVVHAGPGNDKVYGGPGNDTLNGDAGNDLISGEDGADHIRGGWGADRISGQAHDDTIDGGPGVDVIHGHVGDDTVAGGDGGDTVHGEAGTDTLDGTGPFVDSTEHYTGNDTVYGGLDADTIFTGSGDDLVYGGSGDDTADAGYGRDRLFGESGDDTLTSWSLGSTFSGGTGNDDLQSLGWSDDESAAPSKLACGAGIDTALAWTFSIVNADCETVDRH